MDRFIPYEKLSKKKKKERNAEKRNTWTISPVTRRPENPKAYSRKKAQNWKDDLSDSVPYLFKASAFCFSKERRTRCSPIGLDLSAELV